MTFLVLRPQLEPSPNSFLLPSPSSLLLLLTRCRASSSRRNSKQTQTRAPTSALRTGGGLCRSLIHPAATRRTQRCHAHWPSRPPLETVRWLRTESGRPPLRPARLLPRRGPSPPSGSALPPRHQSSPHPRQDRQRSLPVGTAEFCPPVRPSVRGGRGAGAEPGFRVILTHRGGRGGPDPWESSACEALLSGAHLKRSSEPPRAAWGTAPEVCGGFKGGGLEPTESQETPSRWHVACSPQRN